MAQLPQDGQEGRPARATERRFPFTSVQIAAAVLQLVFLLGGLGVALWRWRATGTLANAEVIVPVAVFLIALYSAISEVAGRVVWRAFLVSLPLILLGYAAYLSFEPKFAPEEKRFLYQGLMAGTVVAAGWVFTFIFHTHREEASRHRTLTELMLALRSEIFNYLDDLERNELTLEKVDETVDEILKGEGQTPHHPFIPSGKRAIVFDILSQSLGLLSSETLQPVVAFYTQLQDVETMAHDLQKDSFRQLSAQRRADIYRDFGQMRLRAEQAGCRAWIALNDALGSATLAAPEAWVKKAKANDVGYSSGSADTATQEADDAPISS